MNRILSCLLIILLACVTIGNIKVQAKEKFEYSITTSSPEWKDFTTRDQMIASTRISDKILKDMTTEELVVAVFEYPLLINLVSHNEDEIALREFEKECDAFKELTTRNDAAVVLKNYMSRYTEEDLLQKTAFEVLLNSEKIFNDIAQKEEDLFAQILTRSPSWTFVYTPNNSAIFAFNNDNAYTAAEVTYWNNYYIQGYPNATFISDSSREYNCHSYAWYSSSTSNPWWINQTYQYYNGARTYTTDGSYSRVYKAIDASRVFFQTGDHSMKIYEAYSNSIYNATLISKWGSGPVMTHAVNYSPYSYSGYTMWQ